MVSAVCHLARELRHSPVLAAYLLLGLPAGLLAGTLGLLSVAINYALLALYALVIYLWTRHEPTLAVILSRTQGHAARAQEGRRAITLLLVTLLAISGVGGLWLLVGAVTGLSLDTGLRQALQNAGWDAGLADTAAKALRNTVCMFLPALLVAVGLFRLRPGQIGLVPRRLDLALFLILLGLPQAWLVKLLYGTSTRLWEGADQVGIALIVFAVGIFVNALPEEFLFRGLLFSRLLAWLKNPGTVLVLTSILFLTAHLPSMLGPAPAGVPSWLLVVGTLIAPVPQPTGLIWAYLYYRTASIWPGVLWHASFVTLGVLFWWLP